jgi:hypothetical protein
MAAGSVSNTDPKRHEDRSFSSIEVHITTALCFQCLHGLHFFEKMAEVEFSKGYVSGALFRDSIGVIKNILGFVQEFPRHDISSSRAAINLQTKHSKRHSLVCTALSPRGFQS